MLPPGHASTGYQEFFNNKTPWCTLVPLWLCGYFQGGDLMATIAEKWIEQGKKQGKNQGKKEGKWDVVKKSLKEGLPIKTIERITGFPAEEIHRYKEKFVHAG